MQWGTPLGDQNLSLQTVPFGVTMALSWRPLKRDRCSKTPPRREHPSAYAQQKFLQIEQGQETLSWGKFHGHKEGGEPVPQMELPKHAPYSTGFPYVFPSLHLASLGSWKLGLRLVHLCKRHTQVPTTALGCWSPSSACGYGGHAAPACFLPGHLSFWRAPAGELRRVQE